MVACLQLLSVLPEQAQRLTDKISGKHEGRFEKVAGSFTLVGGKAEGGKVMVEAEIASVKTDQEKLDGHLKSADFFDAPKFPKATFTSRESSAPLLSL